MAQDGQRAGRLTEIRPPGAKAALAEIYNAEDREHAVKAAKAFEADYGAKWPKAVAKVTDDLDVLLEFYNYPAEHWVHLRSRKCESGARERGPGAAEWHGGHEPRRIDISRSYVTQSATATASALPRLLIVRPACAFGAPPSSVARSTR